MARRKEPRNAFPEAMAMVTASAAQGVLGAGRAERVVAVALPQAAAAVQTAVAFRGQSSRASAPAELLAL